MNSTFIKVKCNSGAWKNSPCRLNVNQIVSMIEMQDETIILATDGNTYKYEKDMQGTCTDIDYILEQFTPEK